ncbi:MFS transporter [Sporosarcina oncorhynchi]|uniref:MFS transporter n=1 Tax=Sporosarcina oncorhynchi TaxID=3056444 RepID=A0ABZ0L6G5_9BACL|nr:MFS transporter [Sporosarcina sp. T2O-4]WOV87812.1 MFS transporter [Sporosarcina sp. T2O-4]
MRKNDFIYILSTIVVSLGGTAYAFAISYFILQETGSSVYFSINTAILSIGAILSLPISGVFVDSMNRKKIVITFEALSAVTLLFLAIYISVFGFHIYVLFFITAIRSVITPVISNAFEASLTQLFDKEHIQQTIGKIATYRTTILLLGPVIAGVLYGFLTLEAMIFLFLIMQLISLVSNFFLKFSEVTLADAPSVKLDSWFTSFGSRLIAGYHYVVNSHTLKQLLILSMIINAVGAASFGILPDTIMIKELHFEPYQVGVVSAIFGIGSLIGSLMLSKMKIQNPFAIVKYAFIIVAILLLGFTLPVYVEMITFFSMIYLGFIGLSMALVFQFISIPMSSFMQKTIPDDYKGRVFSINGTLSMVLMPIGTLIYGFLYQRGIYFPVNLFSAIIIIVTVVLTLNTFTLTKSAEEYTR